MLQGRIFFLTIQWVLSHQFIIKGNAQYPSYTLHWRYNDYGQIIAKTDINGDVSYAVQDALGRTASVYYVAHNHSSPQLIQHVQYDSFGRPITLLNGNGLTRKLTYNPFGSCHKGARHHGTSCCLCMEDDLRPIR